MKKVKANQKIEDGTPVLVEWIDPASITGWKETETWARTKIHDPDYSFGMESLAMGFLVHKDERGITIAQLLTSDDTPQIGDIFEIPAGCIQAIYIME